METKRYLDGEVIITTRSDGTVDEHHLLKDHLGSIDIIVEESGQIVQSMSFDPWGQRESVGRFEA